MKENGTKCPNHFFTPQPANLWDANGSTATGRTQSATLDIQEPLNPASRSKIPLEDGHTLVLVAIERAPGSLVSHASISAQNRCKRISEKEISTQC